MPRSVLCCVLPLTQGTPGQVLPPDRDGIVVSSVGSCGRFPLWLRSVRLQELSTTLSEIVQRPALALVDTAFQPRALPRPTQGTGGRTSAPSGATKRSRAATMAREFFEVLPL